MSGSTDRVGFTALTAICSGVVQAYVKLLVVIKRGESAGPGITSCRPLCQKHSDSVPEACWRAVGYSGSDYPLIRLAANARMSSRAYWRFALGRTCNERIAPVFASVVNLLFPMPRMAAASLVVNLSLLK